MIVSTPASFRSDIPLSTLTTIGLGGKARLFVSCKTLEEIKESILFAKHQHLQWQVMGGGSNIIFSDEGFNGVVIKVDIKGVNKVENGGDVLVEAAAGEEWDTLVQSCIRHGLSGIECLSGIPGLVGATPIQNVGAYGQEVSDTITSVRAIDLSTMESVEFSNKECQFDYRQSRFKKEDRNRFVITYVTFRLNKNRRPVIRYPELKSYIDSSIKLDELADGREAVEVVRKAVLALRKRKSMVIDPTDPHTRSVGSFFMNLLVTGEEFRRIQGQWRESGGSDDIPTFPAGDRFKIPAAWLVEHAGFRKGFRRGKVGISANHALALVNYGGTTRELLSLSEEIQLAVRNRFGISLEPEPVIINQDYPT